MTRVLGGNLIVGGLFAVLAPPASILAMTLLIGWLLLAAAIVRGYHAVTSRATGGFFMDLFVAVLCGAGGILLLLNPLEGVLTLTLVIAALFFIEGAFKLVASAEWDGPGQGWMVLSGIAAVLLAILINPNGQAARPGCWACW